MSVCGVCGERLSGGVGHSCFRATVVSSKPDGKTPFWLHDRVDELRAWAKQRNEKAGIK